jgi:hypothetical protein
MRSTGVPASKEPTTGSWRMMEPKPTMVSISALGPLPTRMRSPMAKPPMEATSRRVALPGAATIRKVLPGFDGGGGF